MWTTENRSRYDRSRLRYPSDMTDAEWALIGGLIPPAKRGGNARTVNLREVVNCRSLDLPRFRGHGYAAGAAERNAAALCSGVM